jgi:hypothetical protein
MAAFYWGRESTVGSRADLGHRGVGNRALDSPALKLVTLHCAVVSLNLEWGNASVDLTDFP